MSEELTVPYEVTNAAGAAATWSLVPAAVVVDDVEHLPRGGDGAVRAHLDVPQAGQTADVYSLALQGWAVACDVPVTSIEIVASNVVHGRAEIDRARPDVASYLGDGTPTNSGFSSELSLLGLPDEFELRVQAVLDDGRREAFAVVRGHLHRTPLPAPEPPRPLLMVTLGRTGSTWLTRLLGCHPSIIAYKPFAYEPRVLSYWAKVVLALGDPRSHGQMLAARLTAERWWLGDGALPSLPSPDAAVGAVLGHAGIDALAAFARDRIRAVYRAIADVEKRQDALLFSEKVTPDRSTLEMADWMFPGSGRVYLIRDPRDMALSVLAYNDRIGGAGFGYERRTFLDEVARSAAELLDLFRSDPSRPLLVRYEDLISEPHREMSRIFGAVGVDASPGTVGEVVSAANERLPGMENHRTSTSMHASVGRWRDELDRDQRAVWTEKFADVLCACGYSLDEGS